MSEIRLNICYKLLNNPCFFFPLRQHRTSQIISDLELEKCVFVIDHTHTLIIAQLDLVDLVLQRLENLAQISRK